MVSSKLPNFLYIGTGKAGTTWLFQVLSRHPNVFLTPVKETNFFDLNYERGLNWYAEFFADAGSNELVGEIAHRYLHEPTAPQRIKADLGQVKLIVGVRNPIDYCISDFLFTRRNGQFEGDLREWVAHGFDFRRVAYRDLIQPFVDEFGVAAIYVYNFDDLARSPQIFIDSITSFLGIAPFPLDNESTNPINAAAKPRIKSLARIANLTSKFLKRRGGQRIISSVKYNRLVQRVLYKKIGEKPRLDPDAEHVLRTHARSHAAWLDETFGHRFSHTWGLAPMAPEEIR
ncbi:MAG: sulfotransferase domain-containing protein [Phenylobacterium sp.]|nr:sulfotransferase domain-containing protein [Phenylobacterium sp.]MDP2213494.1 sulfotransferase domain-containing protein [Phenylobacterium sp.]